MLNYQTLNPTKILINLNFYSFLTFKKRKYTKLILAEHKDYNLKFTKISQDEKSQNLDQSLKYRFSHVAEIVPMVRSKANLDIKNLKIGDESAEKSNVKLRQIVENIKNLQPNEEYFQHVVYDLGNLHDAVSQKNSNCYIQNIDVQASNNYLLMAHLMGRQFRNLCKFQTEKLTKNGIKVLVKLDESTDVKYYKIMVCGILKLDTENEIKRLVNNTIDKIQADISRIQNNIKFIQDQENKRLKRRIGARQRNEQRRLIRNLSHQNFVYGLNLKEANASRYEQTHKFGTKSKRGGNKNRKDRTSYTASFRRQKNQGYRAEKTNFGKNREVLKIMKFEQD